MNKAWISTGLTIVLLSVSSRVSADTFGGGDNAFEIEFVTIGNLGNPADTTGEPNPAGSVDYEYRIGKFEVSRDMVEKANAEGRLGLTLDPMGSVSGGPRADIPATGVSWNEAARFANWLNTSHGFTVAYKFSRQPGEVGYDANSNILLWKVGDPGFDSSNPFRNSLSRYFLPSVDEWYKAAYYDPSANQGAGGYWKFPTGSDVAPAPVDSGNDHGTAVYNREGEKGPANIKQAGGLSPYGVMALAGNVWEWEETELGIFDLLSLRGVRGGCWGCDAASLASSDARGLDRPSGEFPEVGFRVASIPEPTSQLLCFLGTLGLLLTRRGAS